MDEKKSTDCRLCKNYSFDRDIEAEIFHCDAGFFNYTDYGGGDITGKFDYGCNGSNFVLDTNSRWYEGSQANKIYRARLSKYWSEIDEGAKD